MLRLREVFSSRADVVVKADVNRGCPQGGVLSPLLWIIVLDELLEILGNLGISAVAYADDVLLLIEGSVTSTIFDLMGQALEKIVVWCQGKGLNINPLKTQAVLFTNRRNLNLPSLTLSGTTIEISPFVKYLGV